MGKGCYSNFILLSFLLVVLVVLIICTTTTLRERAKDDALPPSRLVITTPGLGDREIAAGAADVELSSWKLTADSNGNVIIKEITLTDGVLGRKVDFLAVQNIRLRNNRGQMVTMNMVQRDGFIGGGLWVLTLTNAVVIPARTTIDLMLIGDISPDASPGSTHIIHPGFGPRDGAVATNANNARIPVCWKRADDWPKGHTITIVAPTPVKP